VKFGELAAFIKWLVWAIARMFRIYTISDIIEKILETETKQKRVRTQDQHERFLGELDREIGHFRLYQFDRETYLKWINDFKTRKPKRKTFDDYTKFINIIFNYARSRGHLRGGCLFPKTDPPRGRTGRIYTDAELIRIWAAVMNDKQMRLMFVLSYEMILRKTEMLELKPDRIFLEQRFVRLLPENVKTGSKTGIGRDIPMSDYAHELLTERLLEMKETGEEHLFKSVRGDGPVTDVKSQWAIIKSIAKIEGQARWQDIRHTAYSTAVYEKEVSPARAGAVGGTSIRTLERVYLQAQLETLRGVTKSLDIRNVGKN